MKKTIFLSLDVVLAIHEDMVNQYGGSHGIRDLGLIQSAIARPQAAFSGEELYATIIDKAAALFHSLLFNHAFVDGNKRTSIVTTARFLFVNGYSLEVTNEEFVAFPLQVENKHWDIEQIAAWLEEHVAKI